MKWNKILALIIAFSLSQFISGQGASGKTDKLVTITGKVLTAPNNPVPGAVLLIDNVKTSIVTKKDGSYKIKVNPSAKLLGIHSQEFGDSSVSINGMSHINFLLDKKGATSVTPVAVHKYKAKKMNTYSNIYDMIRAEVPGVVVSGRSITIQQKHSFFGSSTPLFVINGVIVPSIDNVNPVEVRSIGLLRGNEAAIYGVNGSNGVISITLKNGTEKEDK